MANAEAQLLAQVDELIAGHRARRRRRLEKSRLCVVCGTAFMAKRSDARYCGARCRKAAYDQPVWTYALSGGLYVPVATAMCLPGKKHISRRRPPQNL